MPKTDFDDILWRHITPRQSRILSDLVIRYSWWADPKIYQAVPVVYPKTRRAKGAEERRMRGKRLKGGITISDNSPAADAFWRAVGSSPRRFKNATVCHIYGEESVQNPNHFTRLANLTAVPSSLASLTDDGPVNKLLRWHSFDLYSYKGPHNQVPERPPFYQSHWTNDGTIFQGTLNGIIQELRRVRRTKPWYWRKRKEKVV